MINYGKIFSEYRQKPKIKRFCEDLLRQIARLRGADPVYEMLVNNQVKILLTNENRVLTPEEDNYITERKKELTNQLSKQWERDRMFCEIVSRIRYREPEGMYLFFNEEEFDFTLQNLVFRSSINVSDGEKEIEEKVKLISKYLTKVLAYRVWNHYSITDNAMMGGIKKLCLKLAETNTVEDVADVLKNFEYKNWIPSIDDSFPVLNHRNRERILVLLKLLSVIDARDSGEQLGFYPYLHIAHLWSAKDEWFKELDFIKYQNKIGNLVLADFSYRMNWSNMNIERKCEYLKTQNHLARSVCEHRRPHPLAFIDLRTDLYREILKKHFGE